MATITLIVMIISGAGLLFLALCIFSMILNAQGLTATTGLDSYIDAYMRGCFNKSRLRILNPKTGYYVDFVKIMNDDSRFSARFFLEFDSAKCSEEQFLKTQKLLKAEYIDFYITTPDSPQSQKIIVTCNMAVALATYTAELILHDVLELPQDCEFKICCYGAMDIWRNAMKGWKGHPEYEDYLKRTNFDLDKKC